MKISVFGSSLPNPNEQPYKEGLTLGKHLGEAKFTVLTGGYLGIMEAVSRGAAEAGGEVIGVTCEEIETWRPIKANQWVQKERRFKTIYERLHALVKECDAAIALPGGPGTLTEISLTWTLMQTQSIPLKPLILIGQEWRSVFEKLFEANHSYISETSLNMLHFAKDADAAIDLLNELTKQIRVPQS